MDKCLSPDSLNTTPILITYYKPLAVIDFIAVFYRLSLNKISTVSVDKSVHTPVFTLFNACLVKMLRIDPRRAFGQDKLIGEWFFLTML